MTTLGAIRKESQRLIKLKGKFCLICGGKKHLQRHHQTMDAQDFIIICQDCHTSIHMKDGSWGRGLKKIKDCVICGKPFVPSHSKKNVTCSRSCLSELGRRNANKRWHPEQKGNGLIALNALEMQLYLPKSTRSLKQSQTLKEVIEP